MNLSAPNNYWTTAWAGIIVVALLIAFQHNLVVTLGCTSRRFTHLPGPPTCSEGNACSH